MHERLLQGVTVGIVAGLAVYWLTSKHSADYAGPKNTRHSDYVPLIGDIRTIKYGQGTSADCQCCGLPTPQNTPVPLATDYLCNYPEHAPAIAGWSLGASLQLTHEGIDLHSCIQRKETATSFPHGLCGPNTIAKPILVRDQVTCASQGSCATTDCTEVI